MTGRTPADLVAAINNRFNQYSHNRPPLIGTPENDQQLLRDCQTALTECDEIILDLRTELDMARAYINDLEGRRA